MQDSAFTSLKELNLNNNEIETLQENAFQARHPALALSPDPHHARYTRPESLPADRNSTLAPLHPAASVS